MMFDHKHYVPILKTKAGERWAIDHLTPQVTQGITPLFEIHPHDTKTAADHAHEMCENLQSIWGNGARFFLDTRWLHSASGDAAVINSVFSSARSLGLQAVPVFTPSYDLVSLDVIQDIHNQDGRGALLRLPNTSLASLPPIDAIIGLAGVDYAEVDLLLDYRHLPMALITDVPKVPSVMEWRTFTAASSAFPKSVSHLPLNTWHNIPRNDWRTWEAGVTSGTLTRRPAFGDYTVKDHGPPASGGEPSAIVKYTKDLDWLVMMGGRFKQGFGSDMVMLCQSLINSGQFDGAGFSAGDQMFHDVAMQVTGTGNPQGWGQWAMNHHMTYVVRQIALHAGL